MNPLNFDVMAAVGLGAIAALLPTLILAHSPLTAGERRWLGGGIAAWFLLIFGLAAGRVFTGEGLGTPALGVAVVTPLVVALVASWKSPTVRTLAAGTPLALMVALHVGRLLGAQFLLLMNAHRLAPTFATSAGYGDIAAAVLSIPVAFAIHRGVPGWRPWALAWNILGTVDLLTAVALGTGSAEGSPLRFIHETPDSGLMGTLPWALIPGFLVPGYLILHGFIFRRLWAVREGGRESNEESPVTTPAHSY